MDLLSKRTPSLTAVMSNQMRKKGDIGHSNINLLCSLKLRLGDVSVILQ